MVENDLGGKCGHTPSSRSLARRRARLATILPYRPPSTMRQVTAWRAHGMHVQREQSFMHSP